jgi:calcium-dependent protein kinase
VLTYIVNSLTSKEEIQELEDAFKTMDLDNDGLLSRDEILTQYMGRTSDISLATQNVDELILKADVNKNGQIDFSGIFILILILFKNS